jgi:transcription initiation factor TFIID subunit TAF12
LYDCTPGKLYSPQPPWAKRAYQQQQQQQQQQQEQQQQQQQHQARGLRRTSPQNEPFRVSASENFPRASEKSPDASISNWKYR